MRRSRRSFDALVASSALAALGCSGSPSGSGPVAAAPAPTCQCTCPTAAPPPPAPVAGNPTLPTGAPSTELEALVASANRKMYHDDGPGCLADLDRVAAADASFAGRLLMVRAQCEMLSGACQKGKQRIADWYRAEMNMSQDRAVAVAEAMGATRCRGGDSTPRDQLLGALYDLTDGAYMNTKEPSFCRDRLERARRLVPLVRPTGPDDSQIESAGKTLFHTSASCFARAGDCASAWSAFRDNYPRDSLAAVKTDAQREAMMKDTFRMMIKRCSAPP